MLQRFSGADQSVNSKKLPRIFSLVKFESPVLLDYGCGKYISHVSEFIRNMGIEYLPYDPFNMPAHVNASTSNRVSECIDSKSPIDIVCSNVFNVIQETEIISEICRNLIVIADSSGGNLYVYNYFDKRYPPDFLSSKGYRRNYPNDFYQQFIPGSVMKGLVLHYKGA